MPKVRQEAFEALCNKFREKTLDKTVIFDLLTLMLGKKVVSWEDINPLQFNALFEASINSDERHRAGAHYTYESDIKLIVYPCITDPWYKRLQTCDTPAELYQYLRELRQFKALDPACGSGNFLYIAYLELKKLEKYALDKLRELEKKRITLEKFLLYERYVSIKQCYGMDINPFAVELTKVTLLIAKEQQYLTRDSFDNEPALPLDDLDNNIICKDALIEQNSEGKWVKTNWIDVDVIIGNPPFLGSRKMQSERGKAYTDALFAVYNNEVPARADFCVYFFHQAHKNIKPNGFVGLVGTDTIRQNYARKGGLDFIVANNGYIFNAVSSKKWSGEAAVYVSIVNWTKNKLQKSNVLILEEKNDKDEFELVRYRLSTINSSLSLLLDASIVEKLVISQNPKVCFNGQDVGQNGYYVPINEGLKLLDKNPEYSAVLKPYIVGEDVVSSLFSQPSRFVIDFSDNLDIHQVMSYKKLYDIILNKVLPIIQERSREESENLLRGNEYAKRLKNNWWALKRRRNEMLKTFRSINRYIAIPCITQRPIFEFFSSSINPDNTVVVFSLNDDYSFGIIQSKFHWEWTKANGGTVANGYRYTILSIWNSFPFPQSPTYEQCVKVAVCSRALCNYRHSIVKKNGLTLRNLYRTLDTEGTNPLRDLHNALDEAVREAYGFTKEGDILANLLALNHEVARKEKAGEAVTAPGLPSFITNREDFITDDCVRFSPPTIDKKTNI